MKKRKVIKSLENANKAYRYLLRQIVRNEKLKANLEIIKEISDDLYDDIE